MSDRFRLAITLLAASAQTGFGHGRLDVSVEPPLRAGKDGTSRKPTRNHEADAEPQSPAVISFR